MQLRVALSLLSMGPLLIKLPASSQVLAKYLDDAPAAALAPPAIVHSPDSTVKKQYTRTNPIAAWQMLEKSRAAGISLRSTIKLESHDSVKAHECEDKRWLRKELTMHDLNLQTAFGAGRGGYQGSANLSLCTSPLFQAGAIATLIPELTLRAVAVDPTSISFACRATHPCLR